MATPPASSPGAKRRMQANRRRDTEPELAVRRLLHARGWRFRVDYPPVSGLRRRADIVFTRRRLAVYVDGCFWHACPAHGTQSKSNAPFWAAKLAANRRRDRDTDDRLGAAGWTVVRVWEHETPQAAVGRIEAALTGEPPLPTQLPDGGDEHDSAAITEIRDEPV